MKKIPVRGNVENLSQYRDGKDESNLAEFPLALLTDRPPGRARTLEFEDTITDWKTGKEVRQRVCITGSDKFGLPTPKDEDVLLALVQLTKLANNFTSPEVWFIKRQIIELLGWENRGWAYDRIEESLHRWKGVQIHYWNAWHDKALGKWGDTGAVGVIQYFRITDGRRRGAGTDADGHSRFIWNSVLFESFQAGYLKPLNFETYRKLERPAAKRAYRFLDKRFRHQALWEFELRQLACERLGFSRKYDTGQLKERLRPALGELEQIGFIEAVKFRKTKPREWMVGITKQGTRQEHSAPVPGEGSTAEELTRRGVDVSVATSLVDGHSSDLIREKLGYFDWLVSRRDRKISKNAAGFLVASIKQNYVMPREYLRTQKKNVEGLSKRHESSPEKCRATRQKSHAQARNEASSLSPITTFIDQLDEGERLRLIAQAVAEAGRLEADSYHRLKATGGELFHVVQLNLLSKYVRRHALHLQPVSSLPQN